LDQSSASAGDEAKEVLRWGSHQAEVRRVRMLVAGQERYAIETGEAVAFELDVVAHETLEDFVFGVGIFTPRGVECWGSNTDLDALSPERFEGAARVLLHCPRLRLAPGEYDLDVAVHARDGTPYDYRRRLVRFSVSSKERGAGIYWPEHRWECAGGVRWRDGAG
jgi:hypothetical protein